MKIKKCRCLGITQCGETGYEYTKKFQDIVLRRSKGSLSIQYAAKELGISESCYIIREKDCLKHMGWQHGNLPCIENLKKGDCDEIGCKKRKRSFNG